MQASGPMPARGWQVPLAAALAEFARADPRVVGVDVHGSTAEQPDLVDEWSDLDLLITALDAHSVAEDMASHIATCHAPVYASHRSGGPDRHTVRLVLTDLRRIDITVVPTSSPEPRPAGTAHSDLSQALNNVVEEFFFDAVLAAVKAARSDILIGAHLTLGLARHVLVAAMILRDHDERTTHHRYGGTVHDVWAASLAPASAPHDRASITAAIRHYTTVLGDLLAERDITPRIGPGTLWNLLDAVDAASRIERGGPTERRGVV
jgi:hypothetical protein